MKRPLALTGLTVAVALAASGAGARAASSSCPTSNPPNELVLAGGSGQQTQLGKQFAQNLQVALANTNGCPLTGNLAGITVNFDAPGSGASGIFAGSGSREAYVGTDSQGVATAPPFTANFTVGTYTVDAHSDYGTVELSLSNTANGLSSSIAATGASSQEATVNGSYGRPLQARVTDANGNPVEGAAVTFSILPGLTGAGANFLGAAPSATTDSNGLATSPALVANGVPGRFSATASTAGVSTVATYALDNHATTTTLELTSTRDLTATANSRYRSSLQARLLDANGQPIEGATVTFAITAADNGAAASFLGGTSQATALTDANGLATAPPLIADKTAGSFTATATAVGAQ
ncbi:MAG TPA: Ig-like domain-containing protein, partial [Gaiellaceae bacterium]|nr:Ig-like domain-containing protein [Gaiellaceae bacterium]